MRGVLVATLFAALTAHVSAAQVADSTAAAPVDSVRIAPTPVDSVAVRPAAPRLPVGVATWFAADSSGLRPAAGPHLDAVGVLAESSGSFATDFGTPGWPDTWTSGLEPHRTPLLLDGMSYDDLASGMPNYELLPFDRLLALRPHGLGAAAFEDPFERDRPWTELVYRSSSTGLQQVSVTHAQTRAGIVPGAARTTVRFGYTGAGARGEYDGSRLRRKRQFDLQVTARGPGWRVQLTERFNRHRVGAHGGVQPISGFTYTSIYQRFGATVLNPSALRESTRNDLWLDAALVRGRIPLRARLAWTRQRLEYRTPSDTTTAPGDRISFRTEAALRQALRLTAIVNHDRWRASSAWEASPAARTRWQGTADYRKGWGRTRVVARAGVAGAYGSIAPEASASASHDRGRLRPFVLVARSSGPSAAIDAAGFGDTWRGTGSGTLERYTRAEGGIALSAGRFNLTISAFAHGVGEAAVALFDADADTVRVVTVESGWWQRGLRIGAGYRDGTARGLYVRTETTFRIADEDDDVSSRRAEALPSVFGTARAGFRALLFREDLDADLSVRARGWNRHRGMRLHAPTGRLVVPAVDSRPLEASVIVDIVAEGGVRGATLFLILENILSGTNLVLGNQLVPDYPYPQTRLRFGVYWPISD